MAIVLVRSRRENSDTQQYQTYESPLSHCSIVRAPLFRLKHIVIKKHRGRLRCPPRVGKVGTYCKVCFGFGSGRRIVGLENLTVISESAMPRSISAFLGTCCVTGGVTESSSNIASGKQRSAVQGKEHASPLQKTERTQDTARDKTLPKWQN